MDSSRVEKTVSPESAALAFHPDEFAARLRQTRGGLIARGLDAGLFFAGETIYYLTGYDGLTHHDNQILVVPVDQEPFMVIRLHLAAGFRLTSWLDDLVTYRDQADPIQIVCQALGERKLARGTVGLEETAFPLSVKTARALAAALPEARIADCSSIIEELRLVKSEREIQYIRQAAEIADIGMETAQAMIAEGVSEREIAAEVYRRMIQVGGEHPTIPVLVGIEERTRLAMPAWTPRRLQPSEVLWVEVFGVVHRYSAGLKATFGVGPARGDLQNRAACVLRALQRGISAASPGRTASEVAEAVQQTFHEAGYGEFSYHQSGYSTGITFSPHPHEARLLGLKTGNTTKLQPGMTLHVIANLYGDAPAICASHTVVVTGTGSETLTHYAHSPVLFR